jgi:hypothetical protein
VSLTDQSALRHASVLIIGGGGAALRAAIAAYEFDPALDVALITKGNLGSSGVTATACSDRMAFHATLAHTPPRGPDSWRYHADDIYTRSRITTLLRFLRETQARPLAISRASGYPGRTVPTAALTSSSPMGPSTRGHATRAPIRPITSRPL